MQFSDKEWSEIDRVIASALVEDIGDWDATTELLIDADAEGEMLLVAREPLVACGAELLPYIFASLGEGVKIAAQTADGEYLNKGDILAKLTGNARHLMTGERIALNLLQRLSGIATATAKYVEAVKGTKAIILDTRKTAPGLRVLDKYAVRAGGGQNHRMGLYDMVMIKDNHIALAGSLTNAVEKVRAGMKARGRNLPIEVECDTLAQLREVLPLGVDRILLDNMSLEDLRTAVNITARQTPLEASGGVNLSTVRVIAETGVDYISVGALTHSIIASDIGADVVIS